MSTYPIRTEYERGIAIKALQARKLPMTAKFTNGLPRSPEQNKLKRKWMLELEAQGDSTAEQYRGYCKLAIGVPILRHEDEEFRKEYDRIIRPLPYETKLAMMMEPFDFGVTRRMSTKQESLLLDRIYEHFTSEGFHLTIPEPRR